MRVLVIGGTGFLSSAIVREAQLRGDAVAVITRGNVQRDAPPDGVEALRADRSDPAALAAAIGDRSFDCVVDCVLFQPGDAHAAAALFQNRVGRYVFISTDFVYGGEPRAYPIAEDAPRQALSEYGARKAGAEDALFAAHAAHGFPAVVLRPPHILGAGSLVGTGSLEGRDPWILWRLRNRRPLLLLDGGLPLIQPVHRDDIARACFAVADAPGKATTGCAYNIAGPDAVSTRRYYEIVCEILGLPSDALDVVPLPSAAYVAAFPDRASFAANRVYTTERLRRDTGFVPTISLRDALAETIAALEAKGLPNGDPPADPTVLREWIAGQTEAAAQFLSTA